jgi:2-polyprenyl-3-methyl-5-hydroxy-6-metoxy-1,4-benzoquinol methylase
MLMMNENTDQIREAYDEVASEYGARISDELEGKPLDRALLDVFAKLVGSGPRVCDAGCGPGHVARYLHDRGVNVYGFDLSPKMVAEAARRHPGIDFLTADLNDLNNLPKALAGVVAFYSLIHLPRERVATALAGMREMIRPGGLLFLAFHIGSDVLHLDEWWGRSVTLDFTFFEVEEMRGYLTQAGYALEWVVERVPYEGVEHPTRRAYILARTLK